MPLSRLPVTRRKLALRWRTFIWNLGVRKRRPEAITEAAWNLEPGDVLLIQAQTGAKDSPHRQGPIDIKEADWEAIRLATAKGIIVVLPGGNGISEFNATRKPQNYGLELDDNYPDSGAIIVSAASSRHPHTRLDYAPHGKRIDCYAWGEDILTCWSDDRTPNNGYRHFGGTSGAAAAGKAFARLPFGEAAKQFLKEREGRVSERTIQFEGERLVCLATLQLLPNRIRHEVADSIVLQQPTQFAVPPELAIRIPAFGDGLPDPGPKEPLIGIGGQR